MRKSVVSFSAEGETRVLSEGVLWQRSFGSRREALYIASRTGMLPIKDAAEADRVGPSWSKEIDISAEVLTGKGYLPVAGLAGSPAFNEQPLSLHETVAQSQR